MKQKLLKGALAAIVGVGLMAGSALAYDISLLPAEYELVNQDMTGTPTYTAGVDLGYFLWTDDAERYSWHVRWSGDANGAATLGALDGTALDPNPNRDGDHLFSGSIKLWDAQVATFQEYSWDSNDTLLPLPNGGTWIAIANVFEDGFDFTINQIAAPSYLSFELNIDGSQAVNQVALGAGGYVHPDGDFVVQAPVPEPATMLLFGTGLAGLAGISRRRKK